jgi:hypothetical protein
MKLKRMTMRVWGVQLQGVVTGMIQKQTSYAHTRRKVTFFSKSLAEMTATSEQARVDAQKRWEQEQKRWETEKEFREKELRLQEKRLEQEDNWKKAEIASQKERDEQRIKILQLEIELRRYELQLQQKNN